MGFLPAISELATPFRFRCRVRHGMMEGTDRQTDEAINTVYPHPMGRGLEIVESLHVTANKLMFS